MHRLMIPTLVVLAGGCAGTPAMPTAPDAVALALPERTQSNTACGEERVPQDVILHLQLIENMNRQGKYHAAIAHLDALGERGADLPRAIFLRAEALRQVGDRARALELFRKLTKGCLAGLGHHGLARLAVDEGKWAEAMTAFAAAERERPTDPRIRNDHGYALLLAGQVQEARFQFQTAYELGGGDTVAANLLLTRLLEGDKAGADRLATQLGIAPAELGLIRMQAASLRDASKAAPPRNEE